MSRKSLPVVLAESEALRLEEWIRAGSTPQQVVLRARIIRETARGSSDQATATALGIEGGPQRCGATVSANKASVAFGRSRRAADASPARLRALRLDVHRDSGSLAYLSPEFPSPTRRGGAGTGASSL